MYNGVLWRRVNVKIRHTSATFSRIFHPRIFLPLNFHPCNFVPNFSITRISILAFLLCRIFLFLHFSRLIAW